MCTSALEFSSSFFVYTHPSSTHTTHTQTPRGARKPTSRHAHTWPVVRRPASAAAAAAAPVPAAAGPAAVDAGAGHAIGPGLHPHVRQRNTRRRRRGRPQRWRGRRTKSKRAPSAPRTRGRRPWAPPARRRTAGWGWPKCGGPIACSGARKSARSVAGPARRRPAWRTRAGPRCAASGAHTKR